MMLTEIMKTEISKAATATAEDARAIVARTPDAKKKMIARLQRGRITEGGSYGIAGIVAPIIDGCTNPADRGTLSEEQADAIIAEASELYTSIGLSVFDA